MNCAVAARDASRLGRPNTDCTEECAESSAGPDRSLRGADMNAELFGEFTESQQFRLACVTFDCRLSMEEHSRRHGAQPAIPRAKRLQRDTESFGKGVMGEIRIATQLAKRVHAAHTMPFVAPVGKRPPEYQAGDHDAFKNRFHAPNEAMG
jgi:hypothetical protein